MVSPVSFNAVELNPADGFFKSNISNPFGADKALTLNDLFGDGQAWGSSKISERKLALDIIAGGYNLQKIMALNKMAAGNKLKPLIIDTDIGQLIGYAEVTNFAWSDDSPLIISCQLTMPDPYWYAPEAVSVDLGAMYSSGVVFGTQTRIQLNAGDSSGTEHTNLDAGASDGGTRSILDAGGGN